ncbi:MAG: hypothetical protein EA411_02165 [Saprospirales bacterium]|nr:MAG: hypothetical protein EA411_02165 [Saprospirales bacterium]
MEKSLSNKAIDVQINFKTEGNQPGSQPEITDDPKPPPAICPIGLKKFKHVGLGTSFSLQVLSSHQFSAK